MNSPLHSRWASATAEQTQGEQARTRLGAGFALIGQVAYMLYPETAPVRMRALEPG